MRSLKSTEGLCCKFRVFEGVHGLWFLEGLCLRMIPAIFRVIFEAFEVCVLRFQTDAFVGLCLRCQVSQPFEHLCSIYWVSGVRICVQGISTHNSFKICGLKFQCEVFGFWVQSVYSLNSLSFDDPRVLSQNLSLRYLEIVFWVWDLWTLWGPEFQILCLRCLEMFLQVVRL